MCLLGNHEQSITLEIGKQDPTKSVTDFAQLIHKIRHSCRTTGTSHGYGLSARFEDGPVEVYKLESPFGLKKLKPVESSGDDLYSASNFKAKSVACVVSQESTFLDVMFGFENLGFEIACSSSLEATFKTVSEDPEEWALVVVRLDQPLDEERLESYVRLLRMMDVRIPVMIMLQKGKSPQNSGYPKLYADCVVGEPRSAIDLSTALKVAVDANMRWGSSFDDFRREAVNRLCRPRQK